jgi:hypothetical protein
MAMYNLQIKAPSGAIFPIAQDVRDAYEDWDAADMQAATISKLDTVNIRVWGGKVQPIRKEQEAWTVVLTHVPSWTVWGEYKDGYSL